MLDDLSATPWRRRLYHPLNQTVTITRGDARHCTGRYGGEDFLGVPCPERASLSGMDEPVCYACRHARGFNPAFYNAGQRISPQQRQYNAEPHSVYLAHFGRGTIKVGIANTRRELLRLMEQGARAAAIIARCNDAYEARGIEETLAKRADVVEVVRASQKRRLLELPFDGDEAKAALRRLAERLPEAHPIDSIELYCFDEAYGFPDGVSTTLTDTMNAPPFVISGRVLGMVGEFLIVEQRGWLVAGLRKLTGHRVSIVPGEIPCPGVGQTAFSF